MIMKVHSQLTFLTITMLYLGSLHNHLVHGISESYPRGRGRGPGVGMATGRVCCGQSKYLPVTIPETLKHIRTREVQRVKFYTRTRVGFRVPIGCFNNNINNISFGRIDKHILDLSFHICEHKALVNNRELNGSSCTIFSYFQHIFCS